MKSHMDKRVKSQRKFLRIEKSSTNSRGNILMFLLSVTKYIFTVTTKRRGYLIKLCFASQTRTTRHSVQRKSDSQVFRLDLLATVLNNSNLSDSRF